MSRPLATRLVPTSTSSVPPVNASMTRSAAPRRSTTSRSSRPTRSSGKRGPDLALDALGAAAQVADARRATVRAAGRQRRRAAAVVAAQRDAGLVVDERPLALGAGLDVAAVAAQHDRRGPPPIEDQDRLVAGRRVETRQRLGQAARQQAAVAGGKLRPQVDDLDGRRRAARPSRAAPRAGTSPSRARPSALDRGRRRAEDDRGTGQPGELDGGVACLEPGRPVALVRRLVLLVDDHEAHVGERREDGQPRPDDDRRRRPPGSAAIRRPARRRRGPNGRARCRASRSARSRSTSGRASAISGTSTSAGRPASSDAAMAST